MNSKTTWLSLNQELRSQVEGSRPLQSLSTQLTPAYAPALVPAAWDLSGAPEDQILSNPLSVCPGLPNKWPALYPFLCVKKHPHHWKRQLNEELAQVMKEKGTPSATGKP